MVVTSENVSVKSTLKGLQLQCVEGKQYTRRTECIAKNQRQLCSLATKCPEICPMYRGHDNIPKHSYSFGWRSHLMLAFSGITCCFCYNTEWCY